MLAETLLEARILWVLVEPGHRGRLAVPPSLGSGVIPLERLEPQEDLSAYPLEPRLTLLEEFLQGQGQDWGLIVAVPRQTPEMTAIGNWLEDCGGRPLNKGERASVHEAGMEVPFGVWGDPGQSEMWLFLAGGRSS